MKPLFTLLLLLTTTWSFAQEKYTTGPNSERYKGIPAGTVTQHTWESRIYKNTIRDYYVYVPAQYDGSIPAALMVFQDGHTYLKEDGDFRVPIVFDNLISQEKMPVTIGLFINPGHDKDAAPAESPWRVTNRSIEYDEVSDTYGRFLVEELIPELKKKYNISDDPALRAICGLSSGGICAFTVAWFHPGQFHKVLSHIGSFTDIRGGHNYPSMIRKNDRKNIRVFLQDGSNDLDNQFGNLWLANLQMEAALKYKEYHYKFVGGTGEHNGNHGGAILPGSMEWLWRDVVPQRVQEGVYAFPTGDQDSVLMSGETAHLKEMEWKVVRLKENMPAINISRAAHEQIIIVKEGKLEVTLNKKSQTIGPNSVVVVMPGDQASLISASPTASYHRMTYASKKPMDIRRGKKDDGSFIIDFDKLDYKEHEKGGISNYFRRSTAMCPYYEMHVTNLNPGIKSHEPHTHSAAEIILMIEGDTEMEIGNELYKAQKGDVYFLPSHVPHAIKNTGDKQCMYFAFQWE